MNQIGRCEYCGRGMYLSRVGSCDGCGSPYPAVPNSEEPPHHNAIEAQRRFAVIDSQVYSELAASSLLGHPGVNIPIRTSKPDRLSNMIAFVMGGVGAAGRYGI